MPGLRLRVDQSFRLDGKRGVLSRTPLLHDGRLYEIFLYDHGGWMQSRLMCVDATTFELQWEHVEDEALMTVVVNRDGHLLCARLTGSARLTCLDAVTGELRWAWTRDEDGVKVLSDDHDGRVVLSGVGDDDTTWCLDSATGEELWSSTNGLRPSSTPYVHDGRVLLSTERRLNALDVHGGALLWSTEQERSFLFTPAVIDGVVVVGGHGLLDLYDLERGGLLAQVDLGRPRAAIYDVTVHGDRLWFGDSQGLLACYAVTVSAGAVSAVQQWAYVSGGTAWSQPVVVGDRLYAAHGTKLVALDAASGELLGQVGVKGRAGSRGVAVDQGVVYVAAERNLLRVVASTAAGR